MTYTVPLQPQQVAAMIGRNVRAILGSRGRDLDWLADQIDVSTHTILRHFHEGVPAWLTLDIANVLDVDAGTLIEGTATKPKPTFCNHCQSTNPCRHLNRVAFIPYGSKS